MKKTLSISARLLMLFFILTGLSFTSRGSTLSIKKKLQLKEDIQKVWPLAQTVKIEYDLVMAQLEMMDDDEAEKKFLLDYESYVKDKYFNDVIKLNIRQGKILLLLIDREIGQTPYQLLAKFLNTSRADFWQKCAQILGADLTLKYIPAIYPDMEDIIKRLSKKDILIHN